MSLNFSSMKGEYFTMPKQTTYIKGSLYQISCADLQTDPNQPRKYFDPDAQQDLANSLQKQGVLQPILFRADQDGVLFIVAGERRLQAAKEAELETIPAILVEGNYSEIALVENLLRQDLTAIEVAEALDRIMKEHNYTQEHLTTIIGKAKSTVSEILSLNRLPDEIRNECRNDPSVSRQVLLKIAKKGREKGMRTEYNKYKAKKQTKGAAQRKPRGKSTFQTRLTSKFDKMKTFMTDIDLEKLDTAARKDLSSLVEELKKAADGLLKQIKSAPAAKTPPVAEPKPKKVTPKKKPAATVSKTKAKNP